MLRLYQFERAAGDEDPLMLWAPHNDVSPIQAEDEEHRTFEQLYADRSTS